MILVKQLVTIRRAVEIRNDPGGTLFNPAYGQDDITRLISIHQKYHKTGREYNSLFPNFLNVLLDITHNK